MYETRHSWLQNCRISPTTMRLHPRTQRVDRTHTNRGLHPHIPHQSGSVRKPQEQNSLPELPDTKPGHRSSHPVSLDLSSPTHSVRTFMSGKKTEKGNQQLCIFYSGVVKIQKVRTVIMNPWTCLTLDPLLAPMALDWTPTCPSLDTSKYGLLSLYSQTWRTFPTWVLNIVSSNSAVTILRERLGAHLKGRWYFHFLVTTFYCNERRFHSLLCCAFCPASTSLRVTKGNLALPMDGEKILHQFGGEPSNTTPLLLLSAASPCASHYTQASLRPYKVCMFVLVSSKAQSSVAGSKPDTRLHSMDTFNL